MPPKSGEADAVLTLLSVIANPAETKKALEKLLEERKAIDNATEKQREMIALTAEAAKKEKAEIDKERAQLDAVAAKANAEVEKLGNVRLELEHRKGEIVAAEQRLANRMAEIDRREKALQVLTDREAAVAVREEIVEADERKLKRLAEELAGREKKLADDIAENEKWLASLRPPRR
jgi:chromosome segregation ATPase